MASVINETQAIRLFDYEKVFGTVNRTFPETFELPKFKVYEQKNEDCVSYALAAAGEIWFGEPMSPGWSYGMFRSHRQKGLYMEEALKYACNIGMVPLYMFGECSEVPDIIDMVNARPELLEEAMKRRIDGYCKLNFANKEKRDRCIKDAIMRYNDTEHKVAVPATSNRFFPANHAILLVGWNDKNNTWVFQNSEGRDYKNDGRGEIPRDKVNYAYAGFKNPIAPPFDDVPPTDYGYDAITKMFSSGIINGVGERTFNPDGLLTRRDAAIIINRALSRTEEVIANNHRIEYEMKEK